MNTTDQDVTDEDAGRTHERLLTYYDANDESVRLARREGRVELERTRQLLRQVLPAAPASILDVGGADGAHAGWLAEDGHQVTVVDVVPLHVEQARARGLEARVGDARRLEVADASVDVVLLLGPLYHLIERSDRLAALAEARRVLVPGGLLAAAAVSRLAVALDWLRRGRLDAPEARETVRRIVEVGFDDGPDGGTFYFHTPAELRDEVTDAGFAEVVLHGLEGPAWFALEAQAPADDPLMEQVLEIAGLADADPSTIGASAHVLALARSVGSP